MIKRSNALVSITPPADMTGREGHFVDVNGALTGADALPFGVITEVLPNGGDISVAVCAGGFAGTVTVKLAENSQRGALLGSDANGQAADTITGVAVQLLEDGQAGELCEAVIFRPVGA